jgi:hypothetical protein
MRHILLLSVLGVASSATVPDAQIPPPKPNRVGAPVVKRAVTVADFRGTWEGKSMMGPTDSIVTTFAIVATTDGKRWTLMLPDRDLLPLRIIAIGGDSVVTEAGPYVSVLRQGDSVTTRMTGHLQGHMMRGTFEAHYMNGDVDKGKTAATRVKM